MYHHDNRDYAEACSEAARKGRDKMEIIIAEGRKSAMAVIENVQNSLITDSLVKPSSISVREDKPGVWIYQDNNGERELHKNAWNQIMEDTGMPIRYVNELIKQANGTRWGSELVSHNVREIFAHRGKQKNLVRVKDGKVMGWLSDRYRRLDSRPLLDAFCAGCQDTGLLPINGIASDTKLRVRAVLPKVFEPIDNEVMLFGIEWGNSDFGDGGHQLSLWLMRVWCTNLATTEQMLRQVHLGKRLDENMTYSEKTYKLDTQANASALRDVIRGSLSPDKVRGMLNAIQGASAIELGERDAIEKKLKAHLGDKEEVRKVADIYESPDVINLPPEKTLWRLSNAVSWFAQGAKLTPDKKIELAKVAGQLIPSTEDKALSV